MKKKIVCLLALGLSSAWSQRVTDRRSAEIRGGGGEGKCTIEVEVDDVAEVEIVGPNAAIRTLNGSPATFRRFQCNQAMPNRPEQFRFKGIDGRGRQELVRSADDGGRAIIRIEDSKGGREGYTFDIFWRGGSGYGGGPRDGGPRGGGYERGNRGGSRGGYEDDGWNDGWGNGNGWTNNGGFSFEGGRRDSGSYRDRNGDRRRLDAARVFIESSGAVTVSFSSDPGRVEFSGRVERRQGRRIFAQVRGGGMFGLMEIEMSSRANVSRISLSAVGLNWSN
jgi:hypothetical protein